MVACIRKMKTTAEKLSNKLCCFRGRGHARNAQRLRNMVAMWSSADSSTSLLPPTTVYDLPGLFVIPTELQATIQKLVFGAVNLLDD